ncbi:uncharacterized protein TrAtP1_011988 [Trichoderma atroviride]|uniref:uncharacterized protein n=1 Tax=Hypocrea atroviridis TaxID=63577 RepID=UPI00332F3BF9|nr:hypothetical protein TrAtP1_011988 [Trichoderma atroviride]
MATVAEEQLLVQAMGRPSFLGQLYDARSSQLLNYPLFPANNIADSTVQDETGLTSSKYKNVTNSKQRSELLDLKASMSLIVLGGEIKADGSANFVDRSESSESSTAIAGVEKRGWYTRRLDTSDETLQHSVVMKPATKNAGATHVVTAISYGADMLATLNETEKSRYDNTTVGGSLKLEVLQSIGPFGGATGESQLGLEDKKKLHKYELEIRLIADYLDPDMTGSKIPTTMLELSSKLRNANSLLTVPVPVLLTMSPLSQFSKFSVEAFYRELHEAVLEKSRQLFDDLQTVSQDANFLLRSALRLYPEHFPRMIASCEKAAADLVSLVDEYRGDLGRFLRTSRDGSSPETENGGDGAPSHAAFLPTWTAKYEDAKSQHENNTILINNSERMRNYCATYQLPLQSAYDISILMAASTARQIVVVVIPEEVNVVGLENFGKDLLNTVKLLENINTNPDTGIVCCSIYADKLLFKDFQQLDGPSNTILEACNRTQMTKKPCIVSYGISPVLGDSDWTADQGPSSWGSKYMKEDSYQYRQVGKRRG